MLYLCISYKSGVATLFAWEFSLQKPGTRHPGTASCARRLGWGLGVAVAALGAEPRRPRRSAEEGWRAQRCPAAASARPALGPGRCPPSPRVGVHPFPLILCLALSAVERASCPLRRRGPGHLAACLINHLRAAAPRMSPNCSAKARAEPATPRPRAGPPAA